MERITTPEVPELALEFDSANQKRFGPCECCGQMTSRVWGYVYRGDEAIAAYFVEWTPGHEATNATFDLIIGRWGEDTHSSDRRAVSVGFRRIESGPSFMVQDAGARRVAPDALVSKALDRFDVIGTPLAVETFQICDVVYLADPRLAELRG